MKIMKKSLFVLTLVSMTTNLLPHGGGGGGFGGGFATGALLGTGVALAATSGNRRSDDPESTNIRSYDKRIRRAEQRVNKAEKDYNKGKISKEQLEEPKAELRRLNKERAMIIA